MRVTPLAAAIVVVVVLVLAGGITSGLILARDDTRSSTRQVAASLPEQATTSEPKPEPTLAPPATTQPEGLAMPDPGPKSNPVTQAEPSSVETEGPKENLPAAEGDSPGKVYTWQDGDRTQRVVLQPPQEPRDARTNAAISDDRASKDGLSGKQNPESFTWKQPEVEEGQPVFRSESGGELMTLPGGIILALDPEWDQAAVEKFFSDNGISLDRTSELDFLDNGFFVETEPGFPSLELANALAEQDGVALSSPNWAREMELK